MRSVIFGYAPILLVAHDAEDGGWQFLDGSDEVQAEDACVVGLGEVLKRDPSIAELADLPYGWIAWRSSNGAPWQRERSIE